MSADSAPVYPGRRNNRVRTGHNAHAGREGSSPGTAPRRNLVARAWYQDGDVMTGYRIGRQSERDCNLRSSLVPQLPEDPILPVAQHTVGPSVFIFGRDALQKAGISWRRDATL
eukprot:471479-Rhodomonas_salina.2